MERSLEIYSIEQINNMVNWCLESPMEYESLNTLNSFMRSIKVHSSNHNFIDSLCSKLSESQLAELGEKLIQIESIVENRCALEYINGKHSILNEKIARCRNDMVSEGEMLRLNENSNLLLVGSGAIPITGIILAKHFGSLITCLDVDYNAINISRQLIFEFGLMSKFNFICSNILDLESLNDYSHLIITGHIKNKNNLLRRLHSLFNKQIILLRTPKGFYKSVYGEINEFVGYRKIEVLNHFDKMPYESIIICKSVKVNNE